MSMIKLYNPSDESDVIPFEVDDENKFVTHVFEGYDTLEFEIGRDDEIYKAIVEEAKVSDGKNRYVVKSIDERSDFVTIKCDVDVDDFKRKVIYSFRKTNSTLSEVLEEVVPESWTISYEGTFTKRTTVEDTEGKPMLAVTPIEVMDKAATVYGCVYNFNVLEKKLVVIDPKIYKPDGKFFTDELNVENMGFSGSTDGFATRVYGFGKVGEDGVPLTFEDINDGKPYVENVSHSNKIISIGFSDERYTTKDGLLERAKEMLEEVSAPVRSYEFDAKNLDGDVWLYRVVTLIDRRRKTRIDHQIVEWKEYSGKYRYKDKLTLSSKQKDIRSFVDSVKEETKEEVSKSEQSLQSRFEQAIKNATDKITGNSGGNFVWIFDSNGLPTELVNLVDSQDINTAKSVWRWNASGLGHSNNGYNGEMTLALLADGSINASVITTGILTANLIRAGKISDVANKNYWDLETGEFKLSSGTKLVGSDGKETNIGNVIAYDKKITEISAKADSIEIKAESIETKVETVQKDLDSLSIGGTNLLLDTDAPSLTKVAAEYNRRFSSMVDGTDVIGSIRNISDSPCSTRTVVEIDVKNPGNDGDTAGIVFYNGNKVNAAGIDFIPGEEYTMSCYARAISGAPKFNMTIWGLTAWGWRDVPGEWTKFSLTFTATEAFNSETDAWAVFRANGGYIGTLEMTGFKIEKGNKATDWTPAPEDTQVQIDGVVSDVAGQQVIITSQESRISNLELNNESIEASVSRLESTTQTTLDGIETTISELEKKAGLAITEEDVTIAIESKLQNADGIFITGTDYGFSADGLKIAKDGQAMENLLDNSGLEVTRSGEAILTADDTGVNALNLTARQYLIVGNHARFENYGTGRTACFWI